MSRFPWLSRVWLQTTVEAWTEAWLTFWDQLCAIFDRREQAILRSQSFDHLDADLVAVGGGNFDGAGTGGQD